jgi:branched-chain amino acid transport system ATP-binding protein
VSALAAVDLTRHFGAVKAVDHISLSVEPGERHAIIGPNGAGKTTFFNLLAGELRSQTGRVTLHGRDVTKVPAFRRCQLGMARTFQRSNVFLGLSVRENVELAVRRRLGLGSKQTTSETAAVLERLSLTSRADALARSLSHGEQRQLEVALAMASGPSVLLLDEPTAGMSPVETVQMTELIQNLPSEITVLIIEHDMDVVFGVADRITVLHFGQVLASGSPADVRSNALVQEAYLGAAAESAAVHL